MRETRSDYIFKKYGTQRTAMVANQVFMKFRSSVREVGKVYGLSNEEINNITKVLIGIPPVMMCIRWMMRIRDLLANT